LTGIWEGDLSTVYSGTVHSLKEKVVVKIFNKEHEKMREQEIENLKEVSDLCEPGRYRVPKVMGTFGSDVLFLSPVCMHFRCGHNDKDSDIVPQSKHFVNLVALLHAIHDKGFIHRDVKLSNFFPCGPNNELVMLNDWSSAIKENSSSAAFISVAGTTTEVAAEDILKAIEDETDNYIPKKSHDLESLVKTLCMAKNPYFEVEKRASVSMSSFWQKQLSSNYWQKLIKCAQECKYDELQKGIIKLMGE